MFCYAHVHTNDYDSGFSSVIRGIVLVLLMKEFLRY